LYGVLTEEDGHFVADDASGAVALADYMAELGASQHDLLGLLTNQGARD